MRKVEVLVLGAGSAGVVAAQKLGEAGRDVTLVADGFVGGACPYVACMPSKALLRSAATRAMLRHAQDLGGSAIPIDPGPRGAAWALATARRDAVAEHRNDNDSAQQLKKAGVELIRGRGRVVRPGVVAVEDDEIGWDELVIATGSTADVPPIDGLDGAPVWTSDQALSSPLLPSRLLVLGGGPVGCELGQVYARFGSKVTIVEPENRLLSGSHPDASRIVGGALADDGVRLIVGSGVEQVRTSRQTAEVFVAGGQRLEVDRILVAAGRRPAVEGIGLDVLGIEPTNDGVPIDDHCRVPGAEHVWAAGDVTGLAPYTHAADHHAEVIVANLLGRDTTAVAPERIAGCCFTDPAVARIGRWEGEGVRSRTVDHGEIARASADGDRHPGSSTLAADADGLIVGACLVGANAPESILAVATAMTASMTVTDFARTIAPFPTWGEALVTAAKQLADPA
jgi:pyruvate/2-oxoglutarate dehydrogenase complex dihydrolipoamide dehydrogenase (E3) component